jgi:hypothetical protein
MAPRDLSVIRVGGRDYPFPVFSARPGACSEPQATYQGMRLCPKARNNLLIVGGSIELPGWVPVPAKERWNAFPGQEPPWKSHDLSLQLAGEHRYFGMRHHVRIWFSPDGSYGIGQAHQERWRGILRRYHEVTSLEAATRKIKACVDSRAVQVEGTEVLIVGPFGPSAPGAGRRPSAP